MSLFTRVRDDELSGGSKRWRQALEAALRVNEIAASELALQDAVKALLGVAVELLAAEQGSIMLLEEDGRTLVLVASSGLPTEVPLGSQVAVGEGVSGRVLATGKPLLLGDVDREAFVNFVPKSRQIASSVVVPLRIQGRSIGVLNLAISHRKAFTEEDLRFAQLFADQTAGLIHRARLHERAERRSSDLLALVEASKGLLGALDLDPLLHQILDGGARLLAAKEGFACLFDPEGGAISRGVFRGLEKTSIRDLLGAEEVRRAVDEQSVALLQRQPLGSFVAMGLRSTRGTKGLLVLTADHQTAGDRGELLRAYAHQCATTLGAAELYSMVERKESELSSIIHGVPNPIVLVDARNRIVALNSAAEQLFAVSAVFSVGAPVQGALGNEEVEGMLSAQGELHGEVEVGAPPRTYRVGVSDVTVPGAPMGMGRVLIMDDITAEREIAQTQRDFVAMIGHELRTPLTIIKGFARMALKRVSTASEDEMSEALATIDAKSAQLEAMIEDLLYISNIESREASLRVEQADVTSLVDSVCEDLISQHPEREIHLEVPGSLHWPCDQTKLALVLRHLVENALKYSEAPNAVTVRASSEDDELRFDVIDRGVGILSGDLPHIFDRFRQVDNTSTREHGGTGVGLYLCARLVRMHEGRIWVDSAWGKGSTFSFSLPRRSVGKRVVKMTPVAESA
ncbi:MAG: ATP-binding protein [Actinomycetota bacterium]